MNFQDTQIGMQVVRTKGDYVVGRIGEVIERDEDRQRVRVAWTGNPRTWVSVGSIQPTYIAYDIQDAVYDATGRQKSARKYVKK